MKTPLDPRTQKVLANRILARRRLLHFVRQTFPNYSAGWVHEDICMRLERFSQAVAEKKSPRLMLLVPPRHGKLLADDTLVYTDSGWKTHGALQVGDKVLGINLVWTTVIGVSRPGIADVEVTTNAGTKILCHRNHEWAVEEYCAKTLSRKGRRGYYPTVVETNRFIEHKEKQGDMMAARKTTMRRFYLPDILTTKQKLPIELMRVMQLRRRPINGGHLAIEDVRIVSDPQPGKCIQVDAEDGVYLVTRDLVPTHNSELASIRFPAWHLGQHPEHEIINSGYNLDLPMKFSRKVRELLRDPTFQPIFPSCALDPQSQSIEAWYTTAGGGFTAAGVGGGITGKGAHVLIIDDPIKNQEEADSILVRDKLDDWYQSTAYTRLAPGGGVLVIECMTGDTPVLLADGTERRLDQVQVDDHIATYENGRLTTARVAGWKQSGRDSVLKITTTSGRVVRANGRHPFLVSIAGRLVWVRARSLTTAHKIVALPGSGGSGEGCSAPQTDAKPPLSVEGTATNTTTKNDGPTGTAPLQSTPPLSVSGTSNTATGSPQKNTTGSSNPSAGCARSAETRLAKKALPNTGKTTSASTTATKRGLSEASCAITVTPPSDMLELSALHSPWLNTSEFITDQVVSIEPDGEEDVYDLQVERTENFIANGLVSHNTWWNDDDLAGRLQQRMAVDPEADQYEVVRYPAIADQFEYRDPATLEIRRSPIELRPEDIRGFQPLRIPGQALHPDRYPEEALRRIKANMQPRIWSALYQQNPVPDEGMYFTKDMFRFEPVPPLPAGGRIFTAWDFAIGEKQTNDWNVGATILQDDMDRIHVLDVVRFRGAANDIVANIVAAAQQWGSIPGVDYRMGFEDGQIFKALKPSIMRGLQDAKCFPSFEIMSPLTDKQARGRPLQGRMQQGRVFFPENASWLATTMQEMLRFPAGAHDDVVDALAWAVRLSLLQPAPTRELPKPLKSWRDRLAGLGHIGSHMAS
jgi:predicted phage terminase large subunit-like protein